MRYLLLILIVSVLSACSVERSIDKREKFWAKELPKYVPPGTSKAVLEEFLRSHGQTLQCYQNYNTKQDQCDFADNQTSGGTINLPMRLSVVFLMKNDGVVSYQFTTTPVTPAR